MFPSTAASRSDCGQPASFTKPPRARRWTRAAASLIATSSGSCGSGSRPSTTIGRAATDGAPGPDNPETKVSRPQWFETSGSSTPTTRAAVSAVRSTPGRRSSTCRNCSVVVGFVHRSMPSAVPWMESGSVAGGQPWTMRSNVRLRSLKRSTEVSARRAAWTEAPMTPTANPAITARNTDARQCLRHARRTRITTAVEPEPLPFRSPVRRSGSSLSRAATARKPCYLPAVGGASTPGHDSARRPFALSGRDCQHG